MNHVLENFDHIAYVYAQGQLEWEKYMQVEEHREISLGL
jgi:hypothetical protein